MVHFTYEPTEIARFGHLIARLRIESFDQTPSIDDILDKCKSEGIEMLTLRVSCEHDGFIRQLKSEDFHLCDTLIYYETETSISSKSYIVDIREANPSDAQRVGEIARVCFSGYSSHYHADPRLNLDKISDGYVEWAEQSCINRKVASAVLLPIVNGQVAGFATMRLNSVSEGEGVLFAVHPEFSGAGVYGALIDAGNIWCAKKNCDRMVVSTQIENKKVQRSWINRNFRPYRSYNTFHRWFI